MPVNVTGEYRAERGRNVAETNDVRGGREGEIRRSDRRAFDAMVYAEQARICVVLGPTSLVEQVGKTRAHIITLVRKAGEDDSISPNLERERSRAIEQVHVGMERKSRVWDSRALMVAGYDENRHSTRGYASKGFESLIGGARHRSRTVEDVPAVDDNVHLATHCRPKRGVIIREKVVAATVAIYAGPLWQIEPDVRIGHKEDPDLGRHGAIVIALVFIR